jgi:alanine racemase
MKNSRFYRQTWVEINLAALRSNYQVVKGHLPQGTKIMAAVKANAYGHGIVEVSKTLVACGVDYLGVACVDEAVMLRRAGVKKPILHLGGFLKGDTQAFLEYDITATVADLDLAKNLNQVGRRFKKKIKVHVKIDTGMGRLGVWHNEASDFIISLCALEHLSLEGIYTHFPSADSDEDFTHSQLAVFCTLLDKLQIRGVDIPLKHCANSMAVLGFKNAYFNLVRPGLALYGLHPKEDMFDRVNLKPVLNFKTKVVYLKEVEKGRSISYGRTYITSEKTRIATLPVGYGDGYNRLLSNRGAVLLHGCLCPIVGVVCMDQTMVDVGSVPGVKLEDEVVLVGVQKNKKIRVEEIAAMCHTIPYEVVCWISPRVPRLYINQ